MKKSLLFSFIALLSLSVFPARAQLLYAPEKEGTILEYAETDAGGKITGYTVKRVESVLKTEDGTRITMLSRMLDADRAETKMPEFRESLIVTADTAIQPKDDFAAMMDEVMKLAISANEDKADELDASVVVEGDDLIYPLALRQGDKLPPATMAMTMNMSATRNGKSKSSSMKLATIIIDNRVAAGRESVTTDAGTFDCEKITYTVKTKALGGLMSETEYTTVWFAPGVGEVMSRETTKRGKLLSETKLVSIKE